MFKFFARFASPPRLDPTQQALRSLDEGAFERARIELDALLQRPDLSSTERAFLINKRGIASVHLRRLDSAENDFKEALFLRPGYAPALANLGNVALERGELDLAVTHYENALRCDESYAVAHLNLGVAYRRLGRIGDSVRCLRKAQALEGRPDWKPRKRA